MKLKKRTKHIISIVIVVIGAAAIMLLDVYAFTFHDPLSLAFKQFFPAKLVGNHMVSVYDLQNATREIKSLDASVSSQAVSDQLVRSELLRNLARSKNLNLRSDAVTDEMTYIKKSDEQAYADLIRNNFNGSQTDFQKFVAYPQAWEALLKVNYNSELKLNQKYYTQATELLERAKRGEKFEDLAMQYSDDRVTAQLGGDLGFFGHGQILPELEQEVSISKVGQVIDHIVVSRYGYHVVYNVETSEQNGQKVWHAKHILIQVPGFEEWFKVQSSSIRVINIL